VLILFFLNLILKVYLNYKQLPTNIKKKLKKIKATYSSEGPISITTKERVKEKGKKIKELKSTHKILKKINTNYAIYCSPGHFVDFKTNIKKKFQYSLDWEKNQLAIWDNRSMLHQATPFRGNRIMHRITIH